MELKPKKIKSRVESKLNEYKRVLKIAERPDRDEFEMSAKITGAGIILIGAIGFVFYLLQNLIPQYLLG
ncbi:protein translocase SEC61 complex subunit gamma [Candidatus Nanohalococcus occultus]|uniref:Protein translocase subunit SecE n=1 Tax=Candidatus Nanohalococcus occultus TaxID=2978047 RepID=A0ABY8CHI5_9ARCH|nr:Preprotein translocase subunit Sss1 [Candidatus Nanohaloarchaeota archaeon SVXNc]